jgi:hypothetical protein
LNEAEVVDNDLAGEGCDEVVPDLKLFDVFETTDCWDFSDDVLISEVFVTEFSYSAIFCYFYVLPLVDRRHNVAFLRGNEF